ncbi:hypothetical protein GQ53DRAFT_744253 [Thozetella sp. PMI_491]|nr:hypothetical protein GQ53DRAFT_744253 [Thozetella sp. PMI_491]
MNASEIRCLVKCGSGRALSSGKDSRDHSKSNVHVSKRYPALQETAFGEMRAQIAL